MFNLSSHNFLHANDVKTIHFSLFISFNFLRILFLMMSDATPSFEVPSGQTDVEFLVPEMLFQLWFYSHRAIQIPRYPSCPWSAKYFDPLPYLWPVCTISSFFSIYFNFYPRWFRVARIRDQITLWRKLNRFLSKPGVNYRSFLYSQIQHSFPYLTLS